MKKGFKLDFGYYPYRLDIVSGPITISTLANYEQSVSAVECHNGVLENWIFPPPQKVWNLNEGTSHLPYPARIFGLPKTHTFQHATADSEVHISFHIWTLSFFAGMRLTSSEAGFLDATPIRPGQLNDFVHHHQQYNTSIELAERFWKNNNLKPRRSKLIEAIIHALFLGKNPRFLQFESFIYFYMALDACFALAKEIHGSPKHLTHQERIPWMCHLFSMPVPSWADPTLQIGRSVAPLRNDTIHEALFMDEPLGFALHGVGTNQNLALEMSLLVCRLLVALLGADQSDYVRTPVNLRQRLPLDLA